jgi:purine-nucleoside phosphorylase
MTTATFDELVRATQQRPPQVALVLGSGLGSVAARLAPIASVPFAEVPGLPAAAVAGHRGRLSLGDWAGQRVLLFEGRVHFYEGHSWDEVIAPVRVAHALGARVLVQTNAVGGIRDDLAPGSLLLVRDHLLAVEPYFWRRPPRPSPYAPRLRLLFLRAAVSRGIALAEGAYAQVTGPCYETPAEVRALRASGADVVGMSTGREAEEAAALGMEGAAVSCVTNRAAGLSAAPLSHEEVLHTAQSQAERLAELLEAFLVAPGAPAQPAPS